MEKGLGEVKCFGDEGGRVYIKVQDFWVEDIVVYNLDFEGDFVLRDVFEEFFEFGIVDVVGVVYLEDLRDFFVFYGLNKGFGEFFVVFDFVDFVIGGGCVFVIGGVYKVMELGGGEDFVVDMFGIGCIEGIGEGGD